MPNFDLIEILTNPPEELPMSKHVSTLTDAMFATEVLESKAPLVIVDFSAVWCGPCKAMEPVLDAVAAAHAGTVQVYKLDIDHNPKTPEDYRITSVPTVMMFRGGKVVAQITGVAGKAKLTSEIKRHLGEP